MKSTSAVDGYNCSPPNFANFQLRVELQKKAYLDNAQVDSDVGRSDIPRAWEALISCAITMFCFLALYSIAGIFDPPLRF
jgi:hypothetical protein